MCWSRRLGLRRRRSRSLTALTFAPIRFVHPLRVKRLRIFNIALIAAWGVLALITLAKNLAPGPYVAIPLAVIAGYFLDCRPFPRGNLTMLALLTDPNAWAALVTLTVLEIVLGIDNLVFIAVLMARLAPAARGARAPIGLSLAFVFRVLLLVCADLDHRPDRARCSRSRNCRFPGATSS